MTDMNPQERVLACIRRATPDRSPYLNWTSPETGDFVAPWARVAENIAPIRRSWVDEWGCEWSAINTPVGQVVSHPIDDVAQYASYELPEPTIDMPNLEANRREYPDHVQSGGLGFFFFERLEKVRGFTGAMMDLAAEPEAVGRFLDRLTEYYIAMVELYADCGMADCIAVNEDLGLQDRLTISPQMWRELFKPRYSAVYRRAHELGMIVLQHSCGFVQDIIPDIEEAGADIVELQQLACMDMERVAADRDRMVVSAPVDIQAVLPTDDWDRIEAFQKRLFRVFDSPEGGYIPQIYGDLDSLGVPAQTGERLEELILRLCEWRRDTSILD